MMTTVYKYRLDIIRAVQPIEMPSGAEIISVQRTKDGVFMWVRCEPARVTVNRWFVCCGTGWDVPPHDKHIGTVIMDDYVWHFFEVGQPLT